MWLERKLEAHWTSPQKGWMNGLYPLLSSFKRHREDMEQRVAPRVPGHAANQNGPKIYCKVKSSHASGDVREPRRPAQVSWVHVSRSPELYGPTKSPVPPEVNVNWR